MRFQITILDLSKDHLSGKKKPWEDRIEYSSRIVIYALITRLTFVILLVCAAINYSINKGDGQWALITLLSIANLWICGETLSTREQYYRIGFYDGTRRMQ